MSVNASGARLAALTRELSAKWGQTKEYWTDSKCLEFEQKYMNELLTAVNTAVSNIQKLDKMIARVRNDCE